MSGLVRRFRALSFFLVQGAVSGASFLVWALASHVLPAAAQVPAATALGWGMVLYLPLTLGLPYLLPNLYRDDEPGAVSSRQQVLRMLALVATGAAALAVAVAVAGALVPVPLAPLALALALAGGIVLSITVQQLARIRGRLSLLLAAAVANLLLPAGWLVAERLTGSPTQSAVLASALFLVYCLLVQRALGPLGSRLDPGVLASVLRRSAPLVPHLLAFGVLAQGIRFTSGLTGSGGPGLLQAHFVMTFLSMGMTVVSGVQGIVSVDVQLAAPERLRAVVRRSSAVLAATGLLTGVVVVAVYASPVRQLFAGSAPPDLALLAAMVVPLPLQSVYFAVNNLYLREERTVELALASCTTAVVLLAAELALRPPTPALSLALYDIALAALPAMLLARARSAGRRRRALAVLTGTAAPLRPGTAA